ncbi:MAG: hypothetical protein J6U89_08915 [Bacteroidaceae bacterium]|nr:hypothetical protein [Bacteroidaceae bacterium]
MKKIFSLLCVALFATACTTTVKTARTAETPTSLLSATVADLEVSPKRITYTMEPSKKLQRAGINNVKQAAEQEALAMHGNADVLVDAEYIITSTNYLIFGKDIESVTVTGRPAKYVNFRSLNDSVWCNPTFRYNYSESSNGSGGFLNLFKK